MRNCEKIKNLEKELGRYRKAAADRDKLIRSQKEELERVRTGAVQLQAATDGLLTAVALEHGTRVTDEETGDHIGWRLSVPLFDLDTMRQRYEVRARRDEKARTYVLGIVPREGAVES